MAWSCLNISIIVFGLVSIVLISNAIDVDAEADAEKEFPYFGHSMRGKTVTFSYCYSCGYQKAFVDYSLLIAKRYPDITVHGQNYDPPGLNMYISRFVLIVKFLIIMVVLSSFDIFGPMGMVPPSWWTYCVSNKFYTCMMVFFVGNMIEAQMVSSGAFEITLNDVPIWSKLQTGRIPAAQELFQIIESHFMFSDKIKENPDFVK